MNQFTTYLKKPNDKFELSYLAIRRAVGVLGIALPVVVSIGACLFGRCQVLKDSISDYYYTIMGTAFTGILCAVALFMYSYKGLDNWDRITSGLACVFALGVAFFPMNVDSNCVLCNQCNVMSRAVQPWRDNIHFGSAGALFIDFACMSLFLFTKSDKPKSKRGKKKNQRNNVYIICGLVMIAALLMVLFIKVGIVHKTFIPHSTFWMEFVMLWAFGSSWLVKGETILKD